MKKYYKEPKYYSQFSCIGSECPNNCCHGWRIDWMQDEYNKLINSGVSLEIKNIADSSFSYDEKTNYYSIVFAEDNFCPFLSKNDGLCNIQRSMGEEYISLVCRTYPRRFFERDNIIVRFCDTSCFRVIEMLGNDKDAAKLELLEAHDNSKRVDNNVLHFDSVHKVNLSPYLRFRLEILGFYSDLFNSSDNIENSIILGALAANKISDCSEKNDVIISVINKYRCQFNDKNIMTSLDEITTDYKIKFLIINNVIIKYLKSDSIKKNISLLHNGNELIESNYTCGKENFNSAFGKKSISSEMFQQMHSMIYS